MAGDRYGRVSRRCAARRWWPFASLIIAALLAHPTAVDAETRPPEWSAWNASARLPYTVIRCSPLPAGRSSSLARPSFTNAFRATAGRRLRAYKRLGINTIDLTSCGTGSTIRSARTGFPGATDPRRDYSAPSRCAATRSQNHPSSGPGDSQRMAQRRLSRVAARAPSTNAAARRSRRAVSGNRDAAKRAGRCCRRRMAAQRDAPRAIATVAASVLRAVAPYADDISRSP